MTLVLYGLAGFVIGLLGAGAGLIVGIAATSIWETFRWR